MTNLVALARERELARHRLSESYAGDLIDADELDRRLDTLEAATTVAELQQLTRDLIEPEPEPETAIATVGDAASDARIVTVFSTQQRVGAWTPARDSFVVSVFGATVLDLREARLSAGTTVLRLEVVFGSVEVVVLPEHEVSVDCRALFSVIEQDEPARPEDGRGRPRIVLTGRLSFGSLEVHHRLAGESAREAKQRKKQARKQLRAAAKAARALPPDRGAR